MEFHYAKRAQNLKPGDIRELLKIAQSGDVISFAGGSPDSKLFQIEKVKQAAVDVMEQDGPMALQYGATEGYMPLRKLIASERMPAAGVTSASADNIIVTSGSQQGLMLIGQALLDEGDAVICELPTYSGAINAFKSTGCRFLQVEMEEDGMRMDLVEDILKQDNRVKLIYTVPDFQNPSGRVMSLEKRKQLLALSAKYQVPIVEDGPYSDICFGERLPSIKSLDSADQVIYNGSFSKIFSPGLRVAWVCADPSFIRTLTTLKQGTDLQTSSFDQRLVVCYMARNSLQEDIKFITKAYHSRRDAMMKAVEAYFPADAKYTRPEGGFFTWVELKPDLDIREVLKVAIEEKVLFVPGNGFFADKALGNHFARLSYVTVDEEAIDIGVKRLGNVLKKFYQ